MDSASCLATRVKRRETTSTSIGSIVVGNAVSAPSTETSREGNRGTAFRAGARSALNNRAIHQPAGHTTGQQERPAPYQDAPNATVRLTHPNLGSFAQPPSRRVLTAPCEGSPIALNSRGASPALARSYDSSSFPDRARPPPIRDCDPNPTTRGDHVFRAQLHVVPLGHRNAGVPKDSRQDVDVAACSQPTRRERSSQRVGRQSFNTCALGALRQDFSQSLRILVPEASSDSICPRNAACASGCIGT